MSATREDVKKIIWPQLQNTKFKECYIDLLLDRYQKQDRAVNIFLVLITSTSISAWAIWKTEYLQWIWAGLVAASQIVILIKPYLNYTRYIKELSEKYYVIQALTLEHEKLWYNFYFDKIACDAAGDKAFELKSSITQALKFSDSIILPDSVKLKDKALANVLTYLKTTFNYKSKDEARQDEPINNDLH